MENVVSIFREYARLERLREDEGLSLPQLERWTRLKRILAGHFRPGVGQEFADKQSSLRVPSQLAVSFQLQGQRHRCRMTNLSRGGMFVSTSDPLPIGTPITLQIHLEDANETYELSGEVASVNPSVDLRSEEPGMGIRFANLSDEQQQIVDRLYGEAMDVALGRADR